MPEIGGGWDYIKRLLKYLGKYDRINTYVAFVTNKSAGLVPQQQNFIMVPVGLNPESRSKRVLYENTLLQISAREKHLDLMHWFANTISLTSEVPGVVTVYDLLVYQNPHAYPLIRRLYLRAMLPLTVRRAAHILPISETTAQALKRFLNVPSESMQVIPAIIDTSFRPVSSDKVKELRQKYNLPDRFWLYVAHFYPHKNHLRLLKAYRMLKNSEYGQWPLVLRGDDHGSGEEVKRAILELDLHNSVYLLPSLNEDELPTLYSAALALVFSSLFEGIGIPILEALACGCPVLASNIPAINEFGRNAIIKFDPLSVSSIYDSMKKFLNTTEEFSCLRQLGLELVREYRPERVIEELTDVYLRAVRR